MSSEYKNITNDAKIKKKIIKESEGERINENKEVVVHYIWKVNGKIFHNLKNKNMEIIFVNNILTLKSCFKNNSETNNYSHNIYL